MENIKVDCHYCEYAMCQDKNSPVNCYCNDNIYFDHHVTDSAEAKNCNMFEYCAVFPKT